MKFTLLIWLLLGTLVAFGQNAQIDSLKHQLIVLKEDTSRVWTLAELGFQYRNFNPDSGILYLNQALPLAQKLAFLKGEARVLSYLSVNTRIRGDLLKSLELERKSLQISEAHQFRFEMARSYNALGIIYADLGELRKGLHAHQKANSLFKLLNNRRYIAQTWINISTDYTELHQLDSALYYGQKGYKLARRYGDVFMNSFALLTLGDIYQELRNAPQALNYYRRAFQINTGKNSRINALITNRLANFYWQNNLTDSCIYYAQQALYESKRAQYPQELFKASTLLADAYQPRNPTAALQYYKLAAVMKDSLWGAKKVQGLQQVIAAEREHKLETDAAQTAYQNRVRQAVLVGGLLVLLLVAYILYRNYRQQQQANRQLEQQKQEISHQRNKAEQALTDLRTTQTQLIQREKLASLGELTAGIAHEIQNPLNFVNNFSEVSVELVEELEEEANAGRIEDVKAIAGDLRENLQRITQNGQRASNIVKGMLEHSRSSTGERQPTDLNALAGEYLNLAYHGVKAKSKDFNCELKTDFDPELPLLEVVPQDMGRVLLNLFNNAFYAVGQKQKTAETDYPPTVWVSTQQANGQVVIKVRDNGIGIPEAIREKIFQPFFTTKPTGEGTGLGLSLSYDIITKGHGGEIRVDSQTGDHTEFSITLPTSTL